MVGTRIKRLREQLGLSQQQVAGTEMTRAFISLVENGRCNPSPESLRIIAQRLGKPPGYFMSEGEETASQTVLVLLRNVQRALEQGLVKEALVQVKEAIQISQRTEQPEIEAQALMLYGDCLRRDGRVPEAMDVYERVLENHKALGNRRGIARAYLEIGNCALYSEEFPLARRSYEKAARLSEGSKTLAEVWLHAQLFLGTVLYRLGELEAAGKAYRDCLTNCPKSAHLTLWADAAMGLGWVLFRLHRFDEASQWCKRAEEAFLKLKHHKVHEVRQNIAHLEAANQRWEHAYTILMQCLAAYRELGLTSKQVSVLEDLSRYWMQKGDLNRARACLTEARDLLNLHDDGVLRGRIYRALSQVEATDGNHEKAHSYLLISYEILRRIKAHEEAAQTLADIHTLSDTAVQAQ